MQKFIKYLLLCFLFSASSLALFGQTQYATTKDGKQVALHEDGTWKYVKSTNHREQKQFVSPTQKRTQHVKSARTYIRGPRGGCYYINPSGTKTYVDRSMCN